MAVTVLTCSAPTSALSVRLRYAEGVVFDRVPANSLSEANSATVGEQIYLGRLFGYQDSLALQQHRVAGR